MSEAAQDPVQTATFDYWPQNRFWSFQLLRLLSESIGGGAEFTEVHLAARRMRVGQADDWYNGFMELGGQVEGLAAAALAGGHRISARDCWLRASNYYRSAEFLLRPTDSRKEASYAKARGCFLKAVPYFSPAVEVIDIPYEGTALYGYFYHPHNPKPGPYQTLIYFGGADSTAEELYFIGARAVIERGIACLVFDGPGQGASLRLRKIYSRYDYEAPVQAVVDYLETRPDVDRNRIALMAGSLGGYYGPRAAAFEKRLKACVVWGALYEVQKLIAGHPNLDFFAEQFCWLLGTKTFEEALKVLEKFTLEGVVEQITCPILILHGEEDRLVPVSHAYQTYEAARGDKTLKVFKSGEPGAEHCQVDAFSAFHYYALNWLEDKLR